MVVTCFLSPFKRHPQEFEEIELQETSRHAFVKNPLS